MPILIATILFALPVAALADGVDRAPVAAKDCDSTWISPARTAPRDGFQRLDRLPFASAYLTVYRSVGGCPTPVIVRYGIGAPRR